MDHFSYLLPMVVVGEILEKNFYMYWRQKKVQDIKELTSGK